MFNVITADMIKALPPIDGVDAERLPQLLSKVYAHILGLKTKYGQGEIPFVAEELDKDYRMLRGSGDGSLIRCLLAPLMWRNPVQSYS